MSNVVKFQTHYQGERLSPELDLLLSLIKVTFVTLNVNVYKITYEDA